MFNTVECLGQVTKYTCYTFSIIQGIKYCLYQLTHGIIRR